MEEEGQNLLNVLTKSDEEVSMYLEEVTVVDFRDAIKQITSTDIDRSKLITALNILKTI